ncbi:MAG: NAD(P)-dependent oxidoreductase [Flavobacteriales bacterium]
MKFSLIKERKNPPDRRVVFSPMVYKKFKNQYPEAELIVENSDIRVFTDNEYKASGFDVSNHIEVADIMLGVKEVPIQFLIPNKKYFFFSHTIKKQPYNRELLQAILEKNIELYDHETIVNEKGVRLIGFGRYAGIVGAYNGFRTYGLKFDLFHLPKVASLFDRKAMELELDKIKLPNIKIVLTGTGKVGQGAKEILDYMNIKEVSSDEYLTGEFHEPVYTQIHVLDYNKRKNGEKRENEKDFYENASEYEADFMKYAQVSDLYIAGHFYKDGSPFIFTREDAKSPCFKIKVVADISCDIDGPVACTLRASTIENPIYGYDPQTESEVDFKDENAIAVMAVDNLPCELPKDASEGFGEMFLKHVIPAFFNGDKNNILKRAKITEKGRLTERFRYLQSYIEGKE